MALENEDQISNHTEIQDDERQTFATILGFTYEDGDKFNDIMKDALRNNTKLTEAVPEARRMAKEAFPEKQEEACMVIAYGFGVFLTRRESDPMSMIAAMMRGRG